MAYVFSLESYVPGLLAEGVRRDSITSTEIADASIISADLASGSVTGAILATGAVGANQLAAGAVTTSVLADDAVTAAKIAIVTNLLWLNTVTNPTPAASEFFGRSVAAVGNDRMLIGAYGAGAAYLFSMDRTLLTTFNNPTPPGSDGFGYSVAAVASDRVLIGAFTDDTGALDAGAAYLFSTNGTLLTTFTNPTPAGTDYFGYSVAAVGSERVIIGAYRDDTGAIDAGAAYLFSTNGTLLTTFTNPTPSVTDSFGNSMAAVESDRILIAAYFEDAGASGAGAAYLFSTNGTLLATFTNPTPVPNDNFGSSVAVVGSDRVLIGAYSVNTGAIDAGAAYLFSTNGTLLTTFTNPTPAAGDNFGISVVAVGNDRVLIGAQSDDTGAPGAGAAYLFSTNGTLLATVTNPTPANSDNFGISVAGVGSEHVIIGAFADDMGATDAGVALVFYVRFSTPGLIADGVGARSITTSSLEDGAVTDAKISNLDASKITSGTLDDARLSANVARRDQANTFTAPQTIDTGGSDLLRVLGNDPGGTWLHVANSSAGGRPWNFVSTGSGNGEGAGKLLLHDGVAGVRLIISTNGNVGIGTTSPGATLDINGSIRVGGGGTVIQRIQSGQAQVVGGSATARTNLTITFPTAFANPPKLLVSAANDPGWDVDDTFAVSVRKATTTNCVVNIMRVDLNGGWSQWLLVNWQAWE